MMEVLIAERSAQTELKDGLQLLVHVVLIQDDGGNDRVRAEASIVKNNKAHFVGGADIIPYPSSPLFSAIPHTSEFPSKGLFLSVTSALVGAVGPIVGMCLGAEGIQGRSTVRRRIETKIDDIYAAAVSAVQLQLAAFDDFQ